MTAPQRLSDTTAFRQWASEAHARFVAEMNSGRPIVDMIGDGRMEYDGPRCAADDCSEAVDNDGEMCEDCGDQPHEFRHDGDVHEPNWCACGRHRAASFHQDEVAS